MNRIASLTSELKLIKYGRFCCPWSNLQCTWDTDWKTDIQGAKKTNFWTSSNYDVHVLAGKSFSDIIHCSWAMDFLCTLILIFRYHVLALNFNFGWKGTWDLSGCVNKRILYTYTETDLLKSVVYPYLPHGRDFS